MFYQICIILFMGDLANILGKRVRELRLKRGKTQEEYAEFADITMKTLWCIETGKHSSRFDTIEKIANAEKIPYYYLFMNDEESNIFNENKFLNDASQYFEKLDDTNKNIILSLLHSLSKNMH